MTIFFFFVNLPPSECQMYRLEKYARLRLLWKEAHPRAQMHVVHEALPGLLIGEPARAEASVVFCATALSRKTDGSERVTPKEP